jgi:flavin-dependent dehydrogenase
MKVGIIGARLAGSYAGLLLSQLGHEVLLFDPTLDRQKPCGGAGTHKILHRMPHFRECITAKPAGIVRLITPDGYRVDLALSRPIHLISRPKLEKHLLHAAIGSGAKFLPAKALRVSADNGRWAIETSAGSFEFDYLIGADGSNSIVRAALTSRYRSADLSLSMGYGLQELYDPGILVFAYQESGFLGYLWSFPGPDHSGVGILRWLPGIKASDLRRRLDDFVASHYPETGTQQGFYAARIPCLSRQSLADQRVCGDNWALLGDAAGFVDAITAEGIFYALRSAELLAGSFRRGSPAAYEQEWRSDFFLDLESAAAWRDRFYCSMILSRPFTRRYLQLIRHSSFVRKELDTLIGGAIPYSTLFRRVALNSPQILVQTLVSKWRNL